MTVTVKLDPRDINNALEFALVGTAMVAVDKIIPITPRDRKRMPHNINRKDGKAPMRSTYYKPVRIGGNWYMGVSGQLKKSIGFQKVSMFEAKVGVAKGTTEKYAKAQEFGTSRIPPRSYLRKGINDNARFLLNTFQNLFKSKLQ